MDFKHSGGTKLRILQVTNSFKPSWESGGPARVVNELSKKLIEKDHEVTVYTTDGFKKRFDIDKNVPVDVDGITTYYLGTPSSLPHGGFREERNVQHLRVSSKRW